MKNSILALVASLAIATCARASETTIADDIVLDGPTSFKAAADETIVYSGVISGTGPVVIEADSPKTEVGGTIVFSNSGNTYAGGTLISNANFRVDASNAAGTGMISIETGRQKISGTWYNRGRLFVNCTSLTNDIRNYSDSQEIVSGASITLQIPTTLSGKITGYKFASGRCTIAATSTTGSSAVYGDVTIPSGCQLYAHAKYGLDFYGKITTPEFHPFGLSLSRNVNIRTNGHAVSTLLLNSDSGVSLYATNALLGTVVNCADTLSGVYGYRCTVGLHGYPQSFSVLQSTAKNGENSYSVANRASQAQSLVTPADQPATVTLTGVASKDPTTHKTQFGLHGPLSLVIDVDRTEYPNFCQGFFNRDILTSGDVTVRSGKMSTGGYGSFPNVPKVTVEAEGELTVAYTNADRYIFGSLTNLSVFGTMTAAAPKMFDTEKIVLTLGPDAVLTLTNNVAAYRFKEVYTDDGTGTLTRHTGWLDLPQLKGGASIFAEYPEKVTATWTGLGATTSVGDAGNWSTSPDLPPLGSGVLQATFASGGTEAVVDQDLSLDAVAFAGSADFRLVGSKTLMVNGVVSATGENRSYAIDVPTVLLQSDPQTYDVPSGTVLSYGGGLLDQSGLGTVVKSGEGTLAFGDATEITRAVDVQSGKLCLSGTNTLSGQISVQNHSSGGKASLVLSNADVRANLYLNGQGRSQSTMLYARGVTNIVRGTFTTDSSNDGGVIRGDPGSTLILAGGGSLTEDEIDFERNGSSGTARLVVRDKPLRAFRVRLGFRVGPGCVIRLDCANNGYDAGDYMNTISLTDGGRYEFGCDDAVTNCRIWFFSDNKGTLDLLKSRQHFLYFDWDNDAGRQAGQKKNAFVTGEYGSEMGLERGQTFHNYQGGVGLAKLGAVDTTLVFSNNTATSCGDIRVASGTLRFGDKGFWPVGTNVTVEAAGILSLSTSATFGRHVNLAVAEGGKVQLDAGVVQRVRTLTLGGVRREGGTWGSSQSAAAHKDDTYFTGTGVVRVRGGLVIYLR